MQYGLNPALVVQLYSRNLESNDESFSTRNTLVIPSYFEAIVNNTFNKPEVKYFSLC